MQRRALHTAFPSLHDSDLEALLPAKAGDLTSLKLAAPARSFLYELDGTPLALDATGRGVEFIPSIFCLWRVPQLLPQIDLRHAGVSTYLLGVMRRHLA
jgi:Pre-PUA-like domain